VGEESDGPADKCSMETDLLTRLTKQVSLCFIASDTPRLPGLLEARDVALNESNGTGRLQPMVSPFADLTAAASK